MNNKGFILPGAGALYTGLGALAVIALLGVALWAQSARLDAAKATHALVIAKAEALGEQALADKVKKEKEYAKVVEDVSKAWQGSLNSAVSGAVANYRLRHPSSGCCSLSPTPVDPKAPNRTGQESVVTNPGDGFIQDCASDAAKINSFQDWVRGIGFPIK